MIERDIVVGANGVALEATLSLPSERAPVGGIVTLHGAAAGSRDFFLYEHLARLAADQGWAVLRYDRRPQTGGTIPFDLQAADALAAVAELRDRADLPHRAVGLWGVSQGAWTATVAAADEPDLTFLILVGYSGVSPGQQMRYLTTNLLRQHGHDHRALEELGALRDTLESYLRGDLDRPTAQKQLDILRSRPWFELAWVPDQLPPLEAVSFPQLFDFDPTEPLAEVDCPVLAIWGSEDAEVPPGTGQQIVEEVRADARTPTRCELLDGVGHILTTNDVTQPEALHPNYEALVTGWLRDHDPSVP